MEGETSASIAHQLSMFHERVLPTLDNNIKDGNSLIDTDFYGSQLDFGDDKKTKPFSWQNGFPEVFKENGFDIVIGNPPYGASVSREEANYLINKYPTVSKFPDSYCIFMLKAKELLSPKGLFSFIVPNTFCDLESCVVFREWFLKDLKLLALHQTGWAFKDAVVDTVVFISSNEKSNPSDKLQITVGDKKYNRSVNDFLKNDLSKIDYRNDGSSTALLKKLKSHKPLSVFAEIKAGVKLYEKGKGTPPQSEKTVKEKPFTKETSISSSKNWLPLYRGGDIKRYTKLTPTEFVNYGPWLAAPRSIDLFNGEKILMRRTDDKLRSTIDISNSICVNSCHVIKLNPKANPNFELKYLLGLLNSTLLQKIFELYNPQMIGKVFSEIKVIYVERLPIKEIDQKSKTEHSQHDEIIKLVDQLLKLNEEISEVKLETKINQLQSKIDYCENRINEIVYQLYDLTAEEIQIVEGK